MKGPSAIDLLPAPTRAKVAPLVARHGPLLWRALDHFGHAEGRFARPAPHLPAEITPPYEWLWPAFAPWWASGGTDPVLLARAIHQVGLEGLLVLLGQRVTPASLRDEGAIPPARASLLSASAEMLPGGLTVAARARAKHAARSPDPWWGTPSGSPAEQNAAAHTLVERVLHGTTWWNMFGHAVSEVMFEARTETGHGARWNARSGTFVGFLDPFDPPA